MNIGDKERGNAGIDFIWPITRNENFKGALTTVKGGNGFNNISPIFTYSVKNSVVAIWMGDMEHNFLENI